MSTIFENIRSRVQKFVDIISGIINMTKKEIIHLGEPQSNDDTETKNYVDGKDLPITTIHTGMTSFRTDVSNHLNTLWSSRINLNIIINECLGNPAVIDVKVDDIKTITDNVEYIVASG
ncbi:hypothetical protein ACJMK2_027653 [Sinanodonta woodiana]|uniref:Uncharacterized protein n=1 Tax=Sinanodonta woodiana TaxID=1069815 RepID=A0ABD3X4L1_SINWO